MTGDAVLTTEQMGFACRLSDQNKKKNFLDPVGSTPYSSAPSPSQAKQYKLW